MAQQLELKPLAASDLYNRRLADFNHEQNGTRRRTGTHLEEAKCARCQERFDPGEAIVNTTTAVYHKQCFVCAQCFRPFPDGVYFEFDGRKYCEHDFQVLFAPSCMKCHKFIAGRVIKAMNANWHPKCFCCEICDSELADQGFLRNNGRALCRPCHMREKASGIGKHICRKCRGVIDDIPLKYKLDLYHPYHFSCTKCGEELNSDARELKNELYCLKCHDRLCTTCAACRRPIDDARIIHALGKQWHPEHFVCSWCEKPFLGTRYYEKRGKAYCEKDLQHVFGNSCFKCSVVITGDCLEVFQKCWCRSCFSCTLCDKAMDQKSKFYEMDTKPICKKCYDRFPKELQKRLLNKDKKATQEAKKAEH